MGYIGQTPSAVPLDGSDIADDIVDSQHYADGSIDLAHMSSQSVDEDNIHISNAGSNGQFLSKQSGNAGGLTWADAGVTGLTNSSNTTWMTVSADEEVSLPLQPCFNVTAAAQTDQTGDGTIHTANLTQEVFDVGGNFASKMFTAPITGKYILCASLTWVAGMWGTSDSVDVSIITSNRTYIQYQEQTNAAARDMGAFSMAHVADMDAGDTAKITWYISGGSKISDHAAGYYTVLSGCLIA
jgi:hypothetical protein